MPPPSATAPDIEAAVTALLRADVTLAGLVSTRVGTEVPEDPTWPLVVVAMPVAGRVVHGGWAYEAQLDVHAYGADKASARMVGAECQRVLAHTSGTFRDAVITSSRVTTGLRWLLDPSFMPAQPRYLFTAAVVFHPIP